MNDTLVTDPSSFSIFCMCESLKVIPFLIVAIKIRKGEERNKE